MYGKRPVSRVSNNFLTRDIAQRDYSRALVSTAPSAASADNALLTFEDPAGATTYRMDLEDDTEALVLDSPVAPTTTYTLDPATGEIPFESPDGQTTYNLQT